jgi:putative transposase
MKLAKRVQLVATPLLNTLCIKSRNLYNVANWYVRQEFFNIGERLFYGDLYSMLRHHYTYVELQRIAGSHAPQQVLRQVDKAWKAFFSAIVAWRDDPHKFNRRPRPPHYKRPGEGNVVQFTKQQTRVRDGAVRLPEILMKLGMPAIKTRYADIEILGIRIVPFGDRYNYEILHEIKEQDIGLDKGKSIGIDIGLVNTATTSDGLIVKGGAIKSINHFYNKSIAICTSIAKHVNNVDITRYMKKLVRVRNNKIHDKMHQASRYVINHCIDYGISTIFIGYNANWKDGIELGKRNNQNFVQAPLLKFVKQIEYKGALIGITVRRVTEEFTSQTCSRCGQRRKANRVHRGLYTCKRCGLVINADVNAARNIRDKALRERQPVVEAAGNVTDTGGLNPPIESKVVV